MAPLADNLTPVIFIDYTAGGQQHTAQVRPPSTVTGPDVPAVVAPLVTAMQNMLPTSDAVVRVRYRAALDNVSFPVAAAVGPGTVAAAVDADRKPYFMSFTGRSADGRRCRFTLFTPYADHDDLRYRDQTPTAEQQAVLTAIIGMDARSRSGNDVGWNAYVNFGVNSYFQRKMRRTG